MILAGRVTIHGKVVKELGVKCDPHGLGVAVDGEKILPEKPVYFAVYKPKGYVSTNADPSGRPRVLDLLPEVPQRVYTVGRLDEMSNGLILLTNDGTLAHKLAHPKYGVEKLYRVVVAGMPSQDVLHQLTEGIWLAEGKVRAKRVRAVGKRGESTILEMVLSEGKNREVRRMLAKLGHKVMSLTRIAVGPVSIKGLSSGEVRPLTSREIGLLRKVAAGEYIAPFPNKRPISESRPATRPPRPEGATTGPGRPAPRRDDESRGPTGRPQSGRPADGRSQSQDRRGQEGRPQADRRPGDRDRPQSGRPQDRPASGRPAEGRRPTGPPPSGPRGRVASDQNRVVRSSRQDDDDDDAHEPPLPKMPIKRAGEPIFRPNDSPPSQRARSSSTGNAGGPPPRPAKPAPKRDDNERLIDPLAGDFTPRRGRKMIGMDSPVPPPPRPTNKRPAPKPKALRKPPAALKPRRRRPGESD
jgi:23S rRNA pseudouridine2605 synthase